MVQTPFQSAPTPASAPVPVPPPVSRVARNRARVNAGHSPYDGDSNGDMADTSISSPGSENERSRGARVSSQKSMLSRALQQANTAVVLDNAQDFDRAIEAYADACHLLQQVMRGKTGPEDRRKLEAIRKTYTKRIKELQIHDLDTEKELPPEPPSDSNALSPEPETPTEDDDDDEEPAIIEMAVPLRIVEESSVGNRASQLTPLPPRRQSLLFARSISYTNEDDTPRQPEMTYRRTLGTSSTTLEPDFVPAPLTLTGRSPMLGRPPSPSFEMPPRIPDGDGFANEDLEEMQLRRQSRDTASPETTSWLDTIDESGSAGSSLHSRRSSVGIHRKRIQRPTRATEVELSAAMDAAVEAAYGDGFDIAEDDEHQEDRTTEREMVEKETAERESADIDSDPDALAQSRRTFERQRQLSQQAERDHFIKEHQRLKEESELEYALKREDIDRLEADEAEEEERLLDEMTKGYSMAEFHFDPSSKASLPSKSDSSVFSGLTWGSSHSSRTAATGSSIAALAESIQATTYRGPSHPPPSTALPIIPPVPVTVPESAVESPVASGSELPPPRPSSFVGSSGPGVRERRFSGQNAKQLKIETNPVSASKKTMQNPLPILPVEEEVTPLANGPPPKPLPLQRPPIPIITKVASSLSLTSMPSIQPPPTDVPQTPVLAKAPVPEAIDVTPPSPQRPVGRPRVLRKNMSSSSLKMRSLSVTIAEGSDGSPLTPASATFSATDPRRGTGTTPVMPTPTGDDFAIDGTNAGGLYLFDDSVCSPVGSPTPVSPQSCPSPPLPLESCPEAFLLRPFWLMRCLYQTMAHPRGGYISTRLFVPRDVWRVKNVKIKCVEDKVTQCDMLTAALLLLGKVDHFDADAVLDEMQRLESVIEQVRTTLQKKLGSEVGVPGSASLFKGSPATDETNNSVENQLTKVNSNKSYLSSWKKLRSKSSGAGLTNSYHASKDSGKDTLSMSSLPMTPTPTSRPPRRNVTQLQLTGPNANYMGALARLCDAVQVLDQIGRQVEDPGLKYSSKTHVGLELSTRVAAEFFGFFVCRFALNDIGLMLDKFIKRGTEWVLA